MLYFWSLVSEAHNSQIFSLKNSFVLSGFFIRLEDFWFFKSNRGLISRTPVYFAIASPTAWNCLPANPVRNSNVSGAVFRRLSKKVVPVRTVLAHWFYQGGSLMMMKIYAYILRSLTRELIPSDILAGDKLNPIKLSSIKAAGNKALCCENLPFLPHLWPKRSPVLIVPTHGPSGHEWHGKYRDGTPAKGVYSHQSQY